MGFADIVLNSRRSQPQVNSPNVLDAGPDSGVAPAGISSVINQSPGNPYVPGPCNDNSQSTGTFVTSTLSIPTNGTYAIFDILLNLPKSCTRLTIGSAGSAPTGDQEDFWRAFAISLTPTGLNGAVLTSPYAPTGREAWIQLPANILFLPGTTLEFNYPVSRIYFHLMAENAISGETVSITFILDGVKVTYQPDTTLD